jgi:hypothetical protein
LTQIERRQARIRRIHAQFQKDARMPNEQVDVRPEIHHVIGKTQNYPENIPIFLQKNAGDPAIKVLTVSDQ